MAPCRNLATGAVVLTGLAVAGPAAALEIKSSDVHGPDYPTVEAIACMGEKLSDWTNGRITVNIFHSMQLGGEKEALEQVQVGALEMTRVSVGVVGPIVDQGTEVVTEIDKQPFIEATEPVREKFGQKYAELIQRIKDFAPEG